VLRLSRQADALIVGEAQPTRAELPAEDAVLGLEIVDDLALLLVDPACERENEESERVRQRRREAQGSRSAEERPHDRINGHYEGLSNELLAPRTTVVGGGPIRCRERLGGVLKFYYRAAA
jgi:hypothetical protein